MNSTLNAYLRDVAELADRLGYEVMSSDAFGDIRLCPRKGNPEQTIEFRGLSPLDLMRRCLRDLTEEVK